MSKRKRAEKLIGKTLDLNGHPLKVLDVKIVNTLPNGKTIDGDHVFDNPKPGKENSILVMVYEHPNFPNGFHTKVPSRPERIKIVR